MTLTISPSPQVPRCGTPVSSRNVSTTDTANIRQTAGKHDHQRRNNSAVTNSDRTL